MLTHLALRALAGLDAIATLNHICFQAYRTWSAVQLQKQATGVAEDRTEFVPAPQGGGGGAAILTDRL